MSNILNDKIIDKITQSIDYQVRKELIKTNALRTYNGQLYLIDQDKVAHLIPLNRKGQHIIRKVLLPPDIADILTVFKLKQILIDIVGGCELEEIKPTERYVRFQNGHFDLKTQEFTPSGELESNPTRVYFYQINANYSASNDTNIFMSYLKSSIPEDATGLCLQSIGYLLSPVQRMKLAVFLLGNPNTGKSVLLEFLRRLIGYENTSELDLSELGKDNSNLPLLGKQINISEDICSSVKPNMSTLKKAIGNEAISLSGKYVETINTPVRSKFIFAGNSFPSIPPAELPPFIERLLLIPFTKTIPRESQDRDLINKLWEERDSIASCAIRAFAKVYKTKDFALPKSSQGIIDHCSYMLNPGQAFIKDCLEPASNTSFVRSQDLKILAKEYAQINGYPEPKVSLIYQEIQRQYNALSTKKNLKSIHLGNVNGYTKVRFKLDVIEDFASRQTYNEIKQIAKHTEGNE